MVRFRRENFYGYASRHIIENARHLRKSQTEAEDFLWAFLRNGQLEGYRFRRQHPIRFYIADFLCFKAKLIVEVDGEIHQRKDRQEYDHQRTLHLNDMGYKVLRFTNQEVLQDIDRVLRKIESCLHEQPKDFEQHHHP